MKSTNTRQIPNLRSRSFSRFASPWLLGPVVATALGTGCWTRGVPTIDPGEGGGSGGSGAYGGRPDAGGGGRGAYGGRPDAGGTGGARGTGGGVGGDPMNEPPFGNPPQTATAPNKLDLLLMIDNSSSMAPLQAKLAQQLPNMLNGMRDAATGQYPDLHVGVVSSSMGGGAWANVNQCTEGFHPGDDRGKLQQGPGGAGSGACSMLHMGQKFLANGDGTSASPPNFDGDIGAAVQCMALLGDNGCGFESPLKSVLYALHKAQDPLDPDNGGFLRPDARLAIILLTNEDDCSVADDSLLLDPAVNSVLDPTGLGALQSYRCNEFGHLCGGAPPPHGYDFATNSFDLPAGTYRTAAGPGSGGVVLNGCVSADGAGKTDPQVVDPNGNPDPTQGHLYSEIPTLVAAIRSYKTDPADVFVSAIAGPTVAADGSSLYRVFARENVAANNEMDPVVDHSCVVTDADGQTEYADPAVRILQLVQGFGTNGTFYPICASDYAESVKSIASKIDTLISH